MFSISLLNGIVQKFLGFKQIVIITIAGIILFQFWIMHHFEVIEKKIFQNSIDDQFSVIGIISEDIKTNTDYLNKRINQIEHSISSSNLKLNKVVDDINGPYGIDSKIINYEYFQSNIESKIKKVDEDINGAYGLKFRLEMVENDIHSAKR